MASLIQTLAVAEYLNFRHAANHLGVSQSSVSARIKTLEDDLGILLFERHARGVRLTAAGRTFVADVSAGIEHLDHAIKTAGAISSSTAGRLALGLHSSIAHGFLSDLRGRFRQDYPGIEQIVTEGRSAETVGFVRNGGLDVTFVMGVVDTSDCHVRPLWADGFVIALPIRHPLAMTDRLLWADLASQPFLVRRDGAGPPLRDHVVRRLSERGRAPRLRRCDVGRDTLMHMVAEGEGVTLTTEAASYVPFPGIVFRPIADETEKARFSAVWLPHNRNPALLNFLDLAAQMSRERAGR